MAKTTNKPATTTSTAQERALSRFADMLIAKIESLTPQTETQWQKPWFAPETCTAWPKSIHGRAYNGMNALMLLMHCEEKGYRLPVFLTFERALSLNKDAEGNELDLPRVSVRKGEKSFPVFITVYTVVDADGHRMKYDDYRRLSPQEQQRYRVYPKWQVYNVFNVAQTNIEEARPELYKRLEAMGQCAAPRTEEGMLALPAIDQLIAQQRWLCPIRLCPGDRCYFSLSKEEVVMPEKRQFKDGEFFYGNLFHEMAHSTTLRLGRIKEGTQFGDNDYAREELVAELTAALVGQNYGIAKHLDDDSVPYLKGWLKNLREDATFIKTLLIDVRRAASLIIGEAGALNPQAATAA